LLLSFGAIAFAASSSDISGAVGSAQDAYEKLCASFELSENGAYVHPDDYAGTWSISQN
jgi:hypothetical protein